MLKTEIHFGALFDNHRSKSVTEAAVTSKDKRETEVAIGVHGQRMSSSAV